MKSKAIGTLVGLLILLMLYVGAYLSLVQAEGPDFDGSGMWVDPIPKYATYRVGGRFSERFFAPIQWVDTKLRSRYWHENVFHGRVRTRDL